MDGVSLGARLAGSGLEVLVIEEGSLRVLDASPAARAFLDAAPENGQGRLVLADGAEVFAGLGARADALDPRGAWMDVVLAHPRPRAARLHLRRGAAAGAGESATLLALIFPADNDAADPAGRALGEFTGRLAHDLNGIFSVVLGGLGVVREELGSGAPTGDGLAFIEDAVSAAREGVDLVRLLVAGAARQALRPIRLEPGAFLEDLARLLERTLPVSIELRCRLASDLPALEVDRVELERALIALAANAREAMGDGGVLTLAAEAVVVSGEGGGQPKLPAGRYLGITIGDDGEGMTPEVLARATEPFFTTRLRRKARGLGLGAARGFARQSGGDLEIRSLSGEGSEITLLLPVSGG
jgi:signal transduction histidine kinase